MSKNLFLILIGIYLLSLMACKNNPPPPEVDSADLYQQERVAIMTALNNETKTAFQRDFEGWKQYWIHGPEVSKTYMNFVEDDFSESVGWESISEFVGNFIKEHPDPEPVPELLDKIDVRLYGNGAWVYFEQMDSIRGLKRETRLMEKVDGQWKIAGMHTSIYGFEEIEN